MTAKMIATWGSCSDNLHDMSHAQRRTVQVNVLAMAKDVR